jgi:hypothetical protein
MIVKQRLQSKHTYIGIILNTKLCHLIAHFIYISSDVWNRHSRFVVLCEILRLPFHRVIFSYNYICRLFGIINDRIASIPNPNKQYNFEVFVANIYCHVISFYISSDVWNRHSRFVV